MMHFSNKPYLLAKQNPLNPKKQIKITTKKHRK